MRAGDVQFKVHLTEARREIVDKIATARGMSNREVIEDLIDTVLAPELEEMEG